MRSTENPHEYETSELHLQCVTIQATLSSEGLLEPSFIDEPVDGDVYRDLLKEKV